MPKGVIEFHYDSGKSYTKKRKRVPGANPDIKPEIKQFNPYDGLGGFDGINFFPCVHHNNATTASWLPWRLQVLSWPGIGTNFYQRIGNSFFLKAIRFKGYVTISRNVIQPIRWRLKLFRFEKPIPDFKLGSNYTGATNAYLALYKNTHEFAQGLNAAATIETSRHNYYKMIKEMPKDRPYTSKVIASGVIPANNKLVSEGTYQYGQTNSFHVTSKVVVNTNVGNIPVDVLVNCNDRITYSLDDTTNTYTPDIRYCLVLEDDYGMGVFINTASYVQGDTPVLTSPNIEYRSLEGPCYQIQLFGRGYFTDA